MEQQHRKVHHEEVREDHAPPLRLTRDDVLPVAVLEEVRIALCSGDGMLRNIADGVARQRGGKHVRPAHEPIAQVVDVARGAPPSRDEELRASSGLNVLEVLDARVVGVGAEAVLFVVDGAENVVSDALDGKDAGDA